MISNTKDKQHTPEGKRYGNRKEELKLNNKQVHKSNIRSQTSDTGLKDRE